MHYLVSIEYANENIKGKKMTESEPDTQCKKKTNYPVFNPVAMWQLLLLFYMILLFMIGYIAFWQQDFNKPELTVGSYITLLADYREKVQQKQNISDQEVNLIIQQLMKKSADHVGDLQELAAQSFNILLGAILAFLSASTTMVFQQRNLAGKPKE